MFSLKCVPSGTIGNKSQSLSLFHGTFLLLSVLKWNLAHPDSESPSPLKWNLLPFAHRLVIIEKKASEPLHHPNAVVSHWLHSRYNHSFETYANKPQLSLPQTSSLLPSTSLPVIHSSPNDFEQHIVFLHTANPATILRAFSILASLLSASLISHKLPLFNFRYSEPACHYNLWTHKSLFKAYFPTNSPLSSLPHRYIPRLVLQLNQPFSSSHFSFM